MSRRATIRPLLLLLRDARGRFTRLRATAAELLASRRTRVRGPRVRRVVAAVQLALF